MAVRMFAAIDVGSFALELGIYEISDKTGIRNVEHIRHVIALGSDTFSEGKISYDLVDEMCRVLEKFTETMKMYRVKDYRAYATTAMREAKNSRIILDQIRVRTGLEVHIISNSEQRFISYKAVASKGGEFNQIISDSRTRWALVIGDKRINFYLGSSQTPAGCGKIITEYPLAWEGVFTLPVTLVREQTLEYDSAAAAEDEEELSGRLEAVLRSTLERELSGRGEILDAQFTSSASDGRLVVTMRAECMEDIAEFTPAE